MRHKHSHLLVGYWGGLNAAKQSPGEPDFDDAIIECLAPHILILDADRADRISYCVAGKAVERALGVPLRGTSFLDHWNKSDQQTIRDFCGLAIESHRPLYMLSFCGSQKFEFETVLVPLAISNAATRRFIGISVPLQEEPAATPLHRVQHLMHIGFVRDEIIAAQACARQARL